MFIDVCMVFNDIKISASVNIFERNVELLTIFAKWAHSSKISRTDIPKQWLSMFLLLMQSG